MTLWTELLVVFLKRELKIKASYRMSLILGAISGISTLFVYALLGQTALVSVTSESYDMSLASFLISGVAFSTIINSGPGLFSQYSNPAQLEEVLVTPTGFRKYLLTSCLPGLMGSLGGAILFFVVSITLFKLSYAYDLSLLSLIILLGILSSIGLGFIGFGLQLVYKQTSILSWVLFSLTGLVGNMIVPVQILPEYLQSLSFVTPQYYFFTGIRVALGSDIFPATLLLGLFAAYSAILLAAGIFVMDRAMSFIRHNGTHRWV